MKILIAEDEFTTRMTVQVCLEDWGYRVESVDNGADALAILKKSEAPDIAILDWEMPEIDGIEVCRLVKEQATDSRPYVILLTARDSKTDVVRGFDAGADDYMTKPVDFSELVARVTAILRRCSSEMQEEETTESFHDGELEIDWRSRQVYVRGKTVKLSPTEFNLLSCLIKNRGWIVTHEQLLQKVWGPHYIGDKSFVKLYIRYLRQKIEENPHSPRLILTERGVGYRFAVSKEPIFST